MREEIVDYQKNVCHGGQNNFFRTDQVGVMKSHEQNNSGVFVLKSMILADESFENKNSSSQADSLILESNPNFIAPD